MANAARVLRYVAFAFVVLFAVVIGSFVIGEALTDPGGLAGALLSAAWVVPTIGLAGYALRRPKHATRLLTVIAGLTALFGLLDEAFGTVPRDRIGPVGAIAGFAVAVALGFLGLHRPLPAGWLLILLGATNLVGILANMLSTPDGRPLRAALTGSSGAVAIPTLLIGGLFLIAALLERAPGGERPEGTKETKPAAPHRDAA